MIKMTDSLVRHLAMRGGWWTFAEVLSERRPFVGGGGPCHGEPKTPYTGAFTTGELEDQGGSTEGVDVDALLFSLDAADYVVYSYKTPIAWHVPGNHEWVIPDIHYMSQPTEKYPDGGKPSKTTTRHQNLMRTACGVVAEQEKGA